MSIYLYLESLITKKMSPCIEKVQILGMIKKENFPDSTDRASAESDRNFLLRIRERERFLIIKIREALERLEKGEFGICESCGGKISKERLKARPVTTLCIQCKTDAESQEKAEP